MKQPIRPIEQIAQVFNTETVVFYDKLADALREAADYIEELEEPRNSPVGLFIQPNDSLDARETRWWVVLTTTLPEAAPARPITREHKAYVPAALRWAVFERDNFTCRKCGSRQHLETDHIHPESKGGPTTFDNLQTLCRHCNRSKHDHLPQEGDS